MWKIWHFLNKIMELKCRHFDVFDRDRKNSYFTKMFSAPLRVDTSKNQLDIIQWRHSIPFLAKLHPFTSIPSNFICNSTFCRSFSQVRVFTSFNVKVNFRQNLELQIKLEEI